MFWLGGLLVNSVVLIMYVLCILRWVLVVDC